MIRRLVVAGAATLLVLAGCQNTEPTPDPKVAFCDSLRTLATSVRDLRDLGATDTVEDIQSGATAVKDAAQAVREASANLAGEQVDAIEGAAEELRSAADDIDPDATVVEAIQSLVPQILALRASVNDAGETHCGAVLLEAEASAAAEAVASEKAVIESLRPGAEGSPGE